MSSSSTTGNARFLLEEDPLASAESLIGAGRASDAAAMLRYRIETGRGGLLTRLTLQKALIVSGDIAGALAQARETVFANPDIAPAALALGEALLAADRLPAAIGEFQRALRLDPNIEQARMRLGEAWLAAGEAEKALESWRDLEDRAILAPQIADAEQALSRLRCDPRYVRHLFDQFSADYDSRMMEQLGYSAPSILRRLAELLGLDRRGPCSILDLGCGTGLMGATVQDWASSLDGIDLSPAMIKKAKARGIYNDLVVGDICDRLGIGERTYDLVFAADTLVYLGDLAPLFDLVVRRLAEGGHFLCTVEKKRDDGFELGPKRRWRHSESYIRDAAARGGLRVAGLLSCSPRSEAGVPVEGLALALVREEPH
ncbi:MAG TPA: methyltransferase domain-containing protein [Rhizomicrobium sp.]|jgi:predicted TPR repeat methyltransferase